jgi:TPR repeat protein
MVSADKNLLLRFAKYLLFLSGCMCFALAVLPTASQAQESAKSAKSGCVSTAMIRLLAREGNSLRISSSRGLVSQRAGSRENEKGIVTAVTAATLQTLREAHRWFEQGARKGYAPAQVNLAVLSLAGWGTTPNAGAALYWLREAARQGFALAYFDLGILYFNGCGVVQDIHEAFNFFEQGARAGDAAAQLNLGFFYDQGLGVAQDHAQAASWYQKAAESDLAEAQYNLGDLYLRGEGVRRDEKTAFAWFQKAASQGHTGARIMLGAMYAEGRGTPINVESAYAWISAAAMQGDARAESLLVWLAPQLTSAQLAESKVRAKSLAQLPPPRGDAEVAFLH